MKILIVGKNKSPDGAATYIATLYNMLKKNGHEVLEKIRSDKKLKNIPVAVLTSSKDIYDISKAYKNHVNGYMVKKTNLKELSHDIECFYGFSLLTHGNNKHKIRKIF